MSSSHPTVQQVGDFQMCYTFDSYFGWSTEGVTGGTSASFLNPQPSSIPTGFVPLGSRAVTPGFDCGGFLCLKVDGEFVVESIGWTHAWDTTDLPGGVDGWYFEPVAPDGYVALGGWFKSDNGDDPSGTMACVRLDHLQTVAAQSLWSTAGIPGGESLSLTHAPTPASSSPDGNSALYLIPSNSFTRNPAAIGAMILTILPTTLPIDPGAAPALTSIDDPGSNVVFTDDGSITVPYVMVTAGTEGALGTTWQVQNSPWYTLQRSFGWQRLAFHYNDAPPNGDPSDLSWDYTAGFSDASAQQFSHTVGVEVSVEVGVGFLGTGGSVTVSANYEYNYTSIQSRESFVSQTVNVTHAVPPQCAGCFWGETRMFQLIRADGTAVPSASGDESAQLGFTDPCSQWVEFANPAASIKDSDLLNVTA